jgi:8-oxo-dGTP pyrophosphatase MutT (NUDIX family)
MSIQTFPAVKPTFGSIEPEIRYTERRAAYAVIVTKEDTVTTVKTGQSYFLPGGSLPDETPEDTVIREVNEELARSVRLIRQIGEAVQYFYASIDNQYYQVQATFFLAEFIGEPQGEGEHELHWLPLAAVTASFFHLKSRLGDSHFSRI